MRYISLKVRSQSIRKLFAFGMFLSWHIQPLREDFFDPEGAFFSEHCHQKGALANRYKC